MSYSYSLRWRRFYRRFRDLSPFFRFIATLPPIYRHFSILSPIYRHFLNFVGDKKDSRIAWLIHLPTIVFSGAPTRVIANPL